MKIINISVVGALGRMGKLLVKQITNNNKSSRFYIGSFRPATDLNNKEITEKESSLCEKNMLNPVFNEMIKTFIPIN